MFTFRKGCKSRKFEGEVCPATNDGNRSPVSESGGSRAGQQHKPDLDKCIFVMCPKKNRNFEHSFTIVKGKGPNQF